MDYFLIIIIYITLAVITAYVIKLLCWKLEDEADILQLTVLGLVWPMTLLSLPFAVAVVLILKKL